MTNSRKTYWAIAFIILALSIIVILAISLRKRGGSKTSVPTVSSILEVRDLDIVFGELNAAETMIMYSSYNCSFCTLFFQEVYPKLNEEFIQSGKIKLIMRLMGNTGNLELENALKTAVCINKHGNYQYLHELILHDYQSIFTSDFRSIIDEFIEKDITFAECLLGGEADEYLKDNSNDFKNLGLRGTPTFIIGKKIYPGYRDYQSFKEILTDHLQAH